MDNFLDRFQDFVGVDFWTGLFVLLNTLLIFFVARKFLFKPVMKLIKGGRLNFKDMISEIHSPEEAPAVFGRLATDKNFPIGVLFDWKQLL